jgi:GntR family transcriptional regulator
MSERYNQVADRLRHAILTGKLKPGCQLPTERAMCSENGVSRITIRHALRLLEEERLIRRRQGSGTYVSPTPSRRIPLMIDYTGSIHAHAPQLRRSVLRWLWRPAGKLAAGELGLGPEETLLYAERVDVIDRLAVAWDQAFIPRSFGEPLSEADLGHVDFIETWTRRGGFSIEHCRQTIEAVKATADDSRKLSLKEGMPLLKTTEIYFTLGQRPAGLFVSYYHPAFVCISSQYRWGQDTPHKAGGQSRPTARGKR